MSNAPDCVVIGAGVIGCSIALRLQRAGRAVLLLDPGPSTAAASFGNAGMIGANAVIPLVTPGLLRQLPSLLVGERRSVLVRAHALPAAARWLRLCRRMANGEQLLRSRDALFTLHRQTLTEWRQLLGDEAWRQLLRPGSAVTRQPTRSAAAAMASLSTRLRREVNVATRPIDPAALADGFPWLADDDRVFTAVDGTAAVRDPARLLHALIAQFRAAGGTVQRWRARGFALHDGAVSAVVGDDGQLTARHYVLAAGHASAALLPAGARPPLLAERGYHIMLRRYAPLFGAPPDGLAPCVLHDAGHKCVVSEMADGIRVAGFAEYVAPDAPARRACYDRLERYFHQRFPHYPLQRLGEWYGHHPVTPDSLPYIDRHPAAANLICAFGHGHYGMSGAPATARLAAALVTDTADAAALAPFSLRRFSGLHKAYKP